MMKYFSKLIIVSLCLISLNTFSQAFDEDKSMPMILKINTILPPNVQGGLKSVSTTNGWDLLGPSSMTDQSLGLTKAMAVDMTDPTYKTIYVGSQAGGLFKTTDGGSSWTCITDVINEPNLGINSVVIDPNNHNTIYIATNSSGVFKSTDAGNTWNYTGLRHTYSERRQNTKILIDPINSNILYVLDGRNGSGFGVNSYVYRSMDGGATFVLIYTLINSATEWQSQRDFVDIEMKPNDANTLYISSNDYGNGLGAVIIKTSNAKSANISWATITPSIADISVKRIAISVSQINPNCLLAAFRKGTTFYILKSIDSGSTWTNYLTQNNISDSYGVKFGGTGFWRMEMEVSSTDLDVIYIGGFDIDKVTNLGTTVTHLSTNDWANCHVDVRFLKFIKGSTLGNGGVNDILFVCNDGGISKTINGKTWSNINGSGLAISQCWGLGISNLKHDIICSGMQDDNVFTYTDGNWYRVGFGGDGGKVAIDRNDPKHVYNSSWGPNPYFQESFDGALNDWHIMANPGGVAIVLRQVVVHNNNTCYTANHDVFKFNEISKSWLKLSDLTTSCGLASTTALTTFAVAPSDPNYVYATTGYIPWPDDTKGFLYKGTNVEGTSPTWVDISTNVKAGCCQNVTSIEVDPNNPNRVWLSIDGFSTDATGPNRVRYSSDGGLTWADFSTGLPNLPINKIIYQNGSDDVIYAGTDNGVYYYDKSLSTWKAFTSGLPSCIVQELAIDYFNGQLVAATHGRGIWISPLVNNSYNEFPLSLSKSVTWNSPYAFAADITIPSSKTLTITKDLIFKKGATVVKNGGSLILNGGNIVVPAGEQFSGITVENGAYCLINNTTIKDYSIKVKSGGTLLIKGNLTILANNSITVENGAYVCIETPSTIQLTDFNSVINLRPGYINGVNPSLGITSNCVASPATYATTGSGKINTYLSAIFIQNETLTGNRYVSGNTISAGSNVTTTKPQGPVVVKSGSNTVLDAEGNIVLDKGFEVESGALFEAK